jgi:hypothetical protein
MNFSFNLLRIKNLYIFRALLAHSQEALHKRHVVYCARVMSVGWTRIKVKLKIIWSTGDGHESGRYLQMYTTRSCIQRGVRNRWSPSVGWATANHYPEPDGWVYMRPRFGLKVQFFVISNLCIPDSWPLKMVPLRRSEASVRNYHY